MFSCGNIEQKIEYVTQCALKGQNSTYLVQRCKNNHACSAAKWILDFIVNDSANCTEEITPHIFSDLIKYRENVALDGDFCHNNTHCYKNAEGVKCKGSTCVTPVRIGDKCSVNNECPASSFCNQNNTCTSLPKLGESCAESRGCAYNQECVSTEDPYTNFTCQAYLTLENGQYFKWRSYSATPQQEGLSMRFFFVAEICKSGYAVVPIDDSSIIQCRQGHYNVDQGAGSYKRSAPGLNCKIVIHLDPDDYSKAEDSNMNSECGFNQDSSAYCILQYGDDIVVKAVEQVYKNAYKDDSKCHHLSTNSLCKSLYYRLASQENLDHYRIIQKTKGLFRFVADNDHCVKDTITASFWNSPNIPDTAYYFGISRLVIAVSLIIVLFY